MGHMLLFADASFAQFSQVSIVVPKIYARWQCRWVCQELMRKMALFAEPA